MTFLSCLRLPALLAPLLQNLALSVAAQADDGAPLDRDDECSASSSSGDCALSALQRRGSLKSASLEAGGEAPAADTGSSGGVDRRTGEWNTPTDGPLKILFVGNSFSYGPPPADRKDQMSLNNLPRFFKFVAESLGQKVIQEEDTIGGCTLFMHRPSQNPEACHDGERCQPVNLPRVNGSNMCTVPAGIHLRKTFSPCPQRLMREDYGAWDVIVLQDQSYLPTVQKAREKMFYPAIREFAEVADRLESHARRHRPLVALYMTWAYLNGNPGHRLGHGAKGCWPVGSPRDLAYDSVGEWSSKVRSVACQGYSLAMGAASGLKHGGDVVVPAGLAWQAARGSPEIPGRCKEDIDLEYDFEPPLSNLKLPLRASDSKYVRWRSSEEAIGLYRDKGQHYHSKYCEGMAHCHVDHHASQVGMYLNALVFYATLFKKSPIGASWPDGLVSVDGMVLPKVDKADAIAMQHIAHDVVMSNMDTWWKSTGKAQNPCAAGNC